MNIKKIFIVLTLLFFTSPGCTSMVKEAEPEPIQIAPITPPKKPVATNQTDLTEYENEMRSYAMFLDASKFYKEKNYTKAKEEYQHLLTLYPHSRYVPHALYMLSFLETDYKTILDSLLKIKENYKNFDYYDQTLEKLGDLYYIIQDTDNAIQNYLLSGTEKSQYMLATIYYHQNKYLESAEILKTLLNNTTDYELAYKSFLIYMQIFLALDKNEKVREIAKEVLKLKNWAFDDGVRVLYYLGKSYMQDDMLEEALYIFSFLVLEFPLSSEAALANEALNIIEERSVTKMKPVLWIYDYFPPSDEIDILDQNKNLKNNKALENDYENKMLTEGAEEEDYYVVGKVQGYDIRLAKSETIDLMTELVKEINEKFPDLPIGIYYKNDLYFAEIRNLDSMTEAKKIAFELVRAGYKNIKIIEKVKTPKK